MACEEYSYNLSYVKEATGGNYYTYYWYYPCYTPKGWECPKCGRVFAPWISECPYCGKRTYIYVNTTDTTISVCKGDEK